jgi:hypothetical protein
MEINIKVYYYLIYKILNFDCFVEVEIEESGEEEELNQKNVNKGKKSNQISKKLESWAKQRYIGIKRQKKIYFKRKKHFIFSDEKYEEPELMTTTDDFE